MLEMMTTSTGGAVLSSNVDLPQSMTNERSSSHYLRATDVRPSLPAISKSNKSGAISIEQINQSNNSPNADLSSSGGISPVSSLDEILPKLSQQNQRTNNTKTKVNRKMVQTSTKPRKEVKLPPETGEEKTKDQEKAHSLGGRESSVLSEANSLARTHAESDWSYRMSSKNRRALLSRGTIAGFMFNDSGSEFPEEEERLVHTSAEVLETRSESFPRINKEKSNDKDRYFTPYRFQLKEKQPQPKTAPVSEQPVKSPKKRQKSSLKKPQNWIDTRKFNWMRERSCVEENTTPDGNSLNLTSESVKERVFEESRASQALVGESHTRSQYLNSPRRKMTAYGIKTSVSDFETQGKENTLDQMTTNSINITTPIALTHNKPASSRRTFASINKSLKMKLRLPIGDKHLEEFSLQQMNAIYRLNSVHRNKAPWRTVEHSDIYQLQDITELHFGKQKEHGSRLQGGKVQRGTFLTEHSKWIKQHLKPESPGQPAVVSSYKRVSEEVHNKTPHSSPPAPEKRPIEILRGSSPQKPSFNQHLVSSSDFTRVLSSKSFHQSQGVSTEYIDSNLADATHTMSSVWAPPNTPHADELAQPWRESAGSQADEDRFRYDDQFAKTFCAMMEEKNSESDAENAVERKVVAS